MHRNVVIAGGGPTGLLTALGLARRGISVMVVEAEAEPNSSPRALVYHCSVLPHLRDLGILEDCVEAGFWRQEFDWRVHSTGEMIRWDLGCLDGIVEFPYALHLGQDKLSQVLLKHLASYPNVSIRYSTPLIDCSQNSDGVRVEVGSTEARESIEAGWLIGADGAGSRVRRDILKMQFFGVTWPERYVATNTYYDFDSLGFGRTTMQVDPVYGSVICKIANPNFWRVTFTEDASVPLDGLEQRIDKVFAELLPDRREYKVVAFSPYRMHQRVTDRMYQGRVILVGDAAHVTNPTGGLGLTGGMFDSFALVEALSLVINEGVSHDILEYYDRDRRQKFIELVSPQATRNLENLYHLLPGQKRDEWIRKTREIAGSRDDMRRALLFHEQMRTNYKDYHGI